MFISGFFLFIIICAAFFVGRLYESIKQRYRLKSPQNEPEEVFGKDLKPIEDLPEFLKPFWS